MSNDELQKAIDDITRDNAAPVSEKASAETEALVDEMVGGKGPATEAGGFPVPPAPAPEVPVGLAMPPRENRVQIEQSENETGAVSVNSQGGFGGPLANARPTEAPRNEAMGLGADSMRAQDEMGAFQEQLNQQFGGSMVSVVKEEKTEEMAPISAFSGVKVEAEAPTERAGRDFGREMDRESVLSDVAKEALKELYPLLDKVDVTADEKFEICMEAAEDTPEAISSALEAAKRIEDEKSRAEALLKIVKFR